MSLDFMPPVVLKRSPKWYSFETVCFWASCHRHLNLISPQTFKISRFRMPGDNKDIRNYPRNILFIPIWAVPASFGSFAAIQYAFIKQPPLFPPFLAVEPSD